MDADTQTEQQKQPERRVAVMCPHCRRGYKIAPKLLGKRLVCKDCRREWRAERATMEDLRSAPNARSGSDQLSDIDRSPFITDTRAQGGSSDLPPTAGATVAIDMSWAGKRIGRYRARSLLGYGGMGVVWRAHDDTLRRDVALKILSRKRDEAKGGGLNLDLFMQEARAVAKLQHPSVVSIYEISEHDGYVFLSLELMEGGTLKEYVDREGIIQPRKLFGWLVGPAKALALAHRRGVIHRDIKPGNLMFDDHGNLKLMDFGLADVVNEAVSERLRGKAVGSLGWVAPETAKGQPTTAQSDIYSFGLVMLFAMTGRPLIHGKSKSEVIAMHQNPPDPKLDEIKGLTANGRQLMRRCLATEPAERFQNADELAAALQTCGDEDPMHRVKAAKKGVSIAVLAAIIGGFIGVGLTMYYLLDLLNQEQQFRTPGVGPAVRQVQPLAPAPAQPA